VLIINNVGGSQLGGLACPGDDAASCASITIPVLAIELNPAGYALRAARD